MAVKPMGFTKPGEIGQGLAEPSVSNARVHGHLLGTLCYCSVGRRLWGAAGCCRVQAPPQGVSPAPLDSGWGLGGIPLGGGASRSIA